MAQLIHDIRIFTLAYRDRMHATSRQSKYKCTTHVWYSCFSVPYNVYVFVSLPFFPNALLCEVLRLFLKFLWSINIVSKSIFLYSSLLSLNYHWSSFSTADECSTHYTFSVCLPYLLLLSNLFHQPQNRFTGNKCSQTRLNVPKDTSFHTFVLAACSRRAVRHTRCTATQR